MLQKRVEADDANAMHNLACYYRDAEMGLPQDYGKALELWLRGAELENKESQCSIADAYRQGQGVERDMGKAKHYWELAAVGGDVVSRYNLGMLEASIGSLDRAMKHFMISAGAGCDDSLNQIREYFMHGAATKDDFEKALRAHKEAADEMKSDQRAAAAEFRANQRGQN